MVIGPAVTVIGVGGVGGVEEPPRVAATIPPASPAAPTRSTTVNRLCLDFTCFPLPPVPLGVLVWEMMALEDLFPEVAVTLILNRPASSFGVNPLVSARPSVLVRAVWVRIQPLKTPPGPAGGSWNTTSAPITGLSLVSRTSTISGAALRVRMLFSAPSPCTTTIFRSPPGPWTTCCAWHDRAISARNIWMRKNSSSKLNSQYSNAWTKNWQPDQMG